MKGDIIRAKSDRNSKIPDFSSDEEAFEWYESHEMTDHLKDTEEIKSGSIFYQDFGGHWLRASDGMLVSAPKEHAKQGIYIMQGRGRIINEVPLRNIPVATYEVPTHQGVVNVFIQEEEGTLTEEGEPKWTRTTLSSAITLNLETK